VKLPALDQPDRYRGLYVFDFGEWSALGYTAEEIAVLLDSEQYRAGKVYRIHRVSPDGSMDLQGVSAERFQLESATLFWRADEAAAKADFQALLDAVDVAAPPCRAALQLADWQSGEKAEPFVTALVFPAEYELEMGAWLEQIGFEGGDLVEGGISAATDYRNAVKTVRSREQLWSAGSNGARPVDEIMASVRQAVQR